MIAAGPALRAPFGSAERNRPANAKDRRVLFRRRECLRLRSFRVPEAAPHRGIAGCHRVRSSSWLCR